MKHFKTDSDIGAVLIGNEEWTFAIPNKGGDGETDVFIGNTEDIKIQRHSQYESQDYIEDLKGIHHNLTFISSVQGRFGIYDYDCAYSDKEELKKPVETLEGRYGVYKGEWCVAFIKW